MDRGLETAKEAVMKRASYRPEFPKKEKKHKSRKKSGFEAQPAGRPQLRPVVERRLVWGLNGWACLYEMALSIVECVEQGEHGLEKASLDEVRDDGGGTTEVQGALQNHIHYLSMATT